MIDRRRFIQLAGLGGAVGASAIAVPSSAVSEADAPGEAWAHPGLTSADPRGPGDEFTPLRPPATPLAVRSPYLSAWLPDSRLPGSWPTFWNGRITALTGLAVVDGRPYTWCGDPP